jgi:hypothetical protein
VAPQALDPGSRRCRHPPGMVHVGIMMRR